MATSETTRERVNAPAVEIRNCHELEEFRACLELQKKVWGFSDAELVPLRMFVVAAKIGEDLRRRLEDEVGDLLFVVVNIARYLSLDPESALKRTNRKFKRRFQWIEARLREQAKAPQDANMDELENLWQQAKQQENGQK